MISKMFNIENFLIKFKNLKKKDSGLIEALSMVVYKIINVKIEESDIIVKDKVIYIKASGFIKNEILIKKEEILQEVYLLAGKKIENII